MTNQEIRDTLRQALKDWDNATDEQRAAALAWAAALASGRTSEETE